jgi:hypothetical protein
MRIRDAAYPQVQDIFFDPFSDSIKNTGFVFYLDVPGHGNSARFKAGFIRYL